MPSTQLESGTRLRIAKFFDTATPLSLRATLELPWQYYLVFVAAFVAVIVTVFYFAYVGYFLF
jgi:hypothetical protein